MPIPRASVAVEALRRIASGLATAIRLRAMLFLAALCVVGVQCSQSQVTARPTNGSADTDIVLEGLASYGNYRIFGEAYDEKLFTSGVEYDRHSWGHFLSAEADYTAEFLPFVLLDKPKNVDIYGNPLYPPGVSKLNREYVPGIGISPIGFRLLWRSDKAIKPYLLEKGGLLFFDKKVPSPQDTYENFSLQSALGVQVRMNERCDLRLGLFSDFHFSDGFIVPGNPGLDVMNANLGIVYHLGLRGR